MKKQGSANKITRIICALLAACMLCCAPAFPSEAAAIEKAVQKVLEDGYRTGDIWAEGCTKVGTTRMGDLVAAAVK